jgi:hypothetical protein
VLSAAVCAGAGARQGLGGVTYFDQAGEKLRVRTLDADDLSVAPQENPGACNWDRAEQL